MAVLGVVCSAARLPVLLRADRGRRPGRATVITYVNPVVAVALGVTLLDERLGPTAVAGLLLILAGSWLSTGGRMPPGVPVRLRRRAARTTPAPESQSSPASATT